MPDKFVLRYKQFNAKSAWQTVNRRKPDFMTSYQTITLLQQFINVVKEKPNLDRLLQTAEKIQSAITQWLRSVITAADKGKAVADLEVALVNAYAVNLKETGSRKIYAEVEQMLSEIESLGATYGESVSELNVLGDQLTNFIGLYESFLHKTSKENVVALIEIAGDLKRTLNAYFTLATTVEGVLNSGVSFDKEGYAKLSLFLSYEPSYQSLLTKLTAIDQLYNELCNLLEVSSAEYPLQVAKIEAGSLWMKIFGESKVVALLTRLIESGAGYLYRRFTNEGQVASIPRQVEAIEAVLRLSGNLQEMGIDTTEIKDNLQKSAVVVSSKLNDLLLGSPSITVNDQTFSVGDAVTEKYLTESRRLLLDEGKETKIL